MGDTIRVSLTEDSPNEIAVCNDLIAQARSFVSPEQLFEIEAQEAVDRLMITLKVCGTFKSVYFDYKSRANNEVPAHGARKTQRPAHGWRQTHPLLRPAWLRQVPQNPWRIQNTALFPRLDSFLERCHDLLDLCKTVVQFQKLEKIEIGGNKGRTLSASVGQIYTDFCNVLDAFVKVPYDVLDVEVKQFDDDFYNFRVSIKELEWLLTTVPDKQSIAFNDPPDVRTWLQQEFLPVRRKNEREQLSACDGFLCTLSNVVTETS